MYKIQLKENTGINYFSKEDFTISNLKEIIFFVRTYCIF